MLKEMRYPVTPATLLRKRPALKRELLAQPNLLPVRIALLGGSTTSEVKNMLELFLLDQGIQPEFYESGYNRYSEEALFDTGALASFRPDVVYLHTTWRNVEQFPSLLESEAEVDQRVRNEVARFESIWDALRTKLGALTIQNNFDLPPLRPLGNLEATEASGRVRFLMRLNAEFAGYARQHPGFLLNDILYLSAQVGLAAWHGGNYWYNFHMAVSPMATVALAQNVASLVKSVYGKSKKCLVLDLDNTLWGGVIGDDGVHNLVLGPDTAVGEAYVDFQRYLKCLKERGVLLAVCSKNDPENAKEGFSHPDSILKLDDFSAFQANWGPKPDSIRAIAAELNIGLDSMVFLDDNPAERALVSDQLPEVATPDAGSDVARYAEILEGEHYFDVHKIVQDDLNRSTYYNANAMRSASESSFATYGEFLASLEMTAEIAPFSPIYLERITQLINKTNQFNLTTRRYTSTEVEAVAANPAAVTLYGRLADKFGDNGLVTALIGHTTGHTLQLDLWLMSCRVLNREMELAMFDALLEQCRAKGIERITGIYVPSKKNGMVADHYPRLGFVNAGEPSEGGQQWHFDVPPTSPARPRHIRCAVTPAVAAPETPISEEREPAAARTEDSGNRSGCLAYR
ncbi:MAG TPA: HAD-IIIC family phosphatase [Acidobacteriaceae bacterium]|jgi:FkbH-like protein|nr:HAD-IIIC family phosphatase [Acidobacteriaceae bacterium]